jgi:hypothetical protein
MSRKIYLRPFLLVLMTLLSVVVMNGQINGLMDALGNVGDDVFGTPGMWRWQPLCGRIVVSRRARDYGVII